MANLDYLETEAHLKQLPRTMLPGILALLVRLCVERDVFQEGQLQEYVRIVEDSETPAILQDG